MANGLYNLQLILKASTCTKIVHKRKNSCYNFDFFNSRMPLDLNEFSRFKTSYS